MRRGQHWSHSNAHACADHNSDANSHDDTHQYGGRRPAGLHRWSEHRERLPLCGAADSLAQRQVYPTDCTRRRLSRGTEHRPDRL